MDKLQTELAPPSDLIARRRMAGLSMLDAELAEVLGFAQATQAATRKVAALARHRNDTPLRELMSRMGDEAAQVEQRCDVVVGTREGMRTAAIALKARDITAEVIEFMEAHLKDADALDGVQFLGMTKSAEMAHWIILAKLTEIDDDRSLASVVNFALPLQRAHVDAVDEHSLRLSDASRRASVSPGACRVPTSRQFGAQR